MDEQIREQLVKIAADYRSLRQDDIDAGLSGDGEWTHRILGILDAVQVIYGVEAANVIQAESIDRERAERGLPSAYGL